MTKRRAILLIAGMFLLAALALWLNAPKQATQPEADAVTTEYDWALKISRTARTEMSIQELLNALIAENCPAQMVTHARTLHTSPKGEDAWETSSYGEVELIFPEMVRIVLLVSPDTADTDANAAYAILNNGAEAVPLTDAAVTAIPNWRITNMMLLSAESDDFANIQLSSYAETILLGT